MTIGDIITQGLHYARTSRSLWLFGFLVGMASGGSSGGPGGRGGGGGPAHAAAWALSDQGWTVLIGVVLLVVAVVTVLRFIGEGALIEGIVQARQGGSMSTGEGFRVGWAHWGVLLRIGLLYLAVMSAGVASVVVPGLLAVRSVGPVGLLAALPFLVVVVPVLVTAYMVQAFAMRIAVLENRRALDAIAKARLFLHGRIAHGLTVMVAAVIGSLGFAAVAAVTIGPVVVLLVAMLPVLHTVRTVVLGGVILIPLIGILTAMLGTFRSSIWTIAYLSQVES